ncbi:MAG TPA: RluA family pseudouridine synthase [Haliangiales bacterium]|nr:RluA family pseudouridine synthase [Haliangiales bacterium]
MVEEHRYRVAEGDAGARVDAFLAGQKLPFSRSQLKRRIDAGEVRVNGEATKPSRKLRAGDEVVLAAAPPEPTALVGEDLPLAVLYEDAHLIAIDKPAGMVVHPAAGHGRGTLVHALLHHCPDLAGIGGEIRPGIVHRLDKDTTGVLVATKDEPTQVAMAALFKVKDLTRVYQAVVSPPPPQDAGTIRSLYGRHPVHRKRFTSRVAEGKPAVTHYRVIERFGDAAALVECRLDTGRTHQIRVHMAESGHPVVGDRVYGRRPRDPRLAELARALGRQALHAAVLRFRHPVTGATIDLAAAIPADMQNLIDELRRGVGSPA